MRSDFVTFFFPGNRRGKRGTIVEDAAGNGIPLYVDGDVSKGNSTLEDGYRRYGGVGVAMNPAGSRAQVNTKRGTGSYQPPDEILRLSIDQQPKWINVDSEFDVGLGDHLLVPVDKKSQQVLSEFCKNLEYLPADCEINVLNAIRRPSLELRVARLERTAKFGPQEERGRETAPADRDQSWWGRLRNRFFRPIGPKWLMPLLLTVLAFAAGIFVRPFLPFQNPAEEKPSRQVERRNAQSEKPPARDAEKQTGGVRTGQSSDAMIVVNANNQAVKTDLPFEELAKILRGERPKWKSLPVIVVWSKVDTPEQKAVLVALTIDPDPKAFQSHFEPLPPEPGPLLQLVGSEKEAIDFVKARVGAIAVVSSKTEIPEKLKMLTISGKKPGDSGYLQER
jgi:hypothetical protein